MFCLASQVKNLLTRTWLSKQGALEATPTSERRSKKRPFLSSALSHCVRPEPISHLELWLQYKTEGFCLCAVLTKSRFQKSSLISESVCWGQVVEEEGRKPYMEMHLTEAGRSTKFCFWLGVLPSFPGCGYPPPCGRLRPTLLLVHGATPY